MSEEKLRKLMEKLESDKDPEIIRELLKELNTLQKDKPEDYEKYKALKKWVMRISQEIFSGRI